MTMANSVFFQCLAGNSMNRPYIFCHMMISLDGKINGSFMGTPEANAAGDWFYNIAFDKASYYKHQGWISGRVTTDDNFTFYDAPELDNDITEISPGDFIAEHNQTIYYVSIDPSGKLGWKSNEVVYGDTHAHVVEILSDQASINYKAYLRKLGISYIIAGEETIDIPKAMEKCKILFNMETLMLGGGGVVNWSFIEMGICDEVSIVIAPVADGSSDSASLFETRQNLSNEKSISFKLQHIEARDNGTIWLRYLIDKESC